MSIGQDEDIRIYQLPEIQELSGGMKVAVDSETDGTKSFDIGTALGEKVDAPSTTPEAGQVLTFDGTNNVWADAPEGVYVLNYSDITSYNDIDAERAGSQPTFIKIDSSVPLTIQGISGPTTINMENQIMQLTDYNVNNAWHVFRGYNMGSFPGNSPTVDRVGSSYHFEVVLQIFRPEVTENTKLWSVFGDYMDGRNVFNTEPQPYTVSYNNGKGGDLSGKTGRSTAVQFTASNGEYRKNLLMPYEIQDHLFYSDASPELLQFMAWGSTSNRAGYRTCLIATHSTKSSEYPTQTPTVAFNRYVMGSSETSDNVATSVSVEMISSVSGQGSAMFGGNLVPTLGSTAGALQYWSDSNGGHYGWKPVNEVPASTSSDEGKVLTVDSNGAAAWSSISSLTSDLVLVTGSTGAEKAANCQAIIDAGKIPIYNFPIINNSIGQAINRILIYEYSDDSYFYFTGMYPNYFNSQFRADDADILFPFFHFSKTTFGHGYTERTLGDLPISTIPISSDSNSITIKNNRLIVISTSYTDGKSAYTVKISSHGFATNAVFEINPSVNMTLSVEKIDVTGTSTPLKYSVAAGNTLEAGKYYQVTAVGNCWTLAEFANPS